MAKISLEIIPWLAETLGMERQSDEFVPDDRVFSVSDLLDRLAGKYPRFSDIVFDINAQRLTGRTLVFLNGTNIEILDGLETGLQDGDVINLVPVVEGG